MADISPSASIARIERALARIEAIAARPADGRYQRLRERTHAALASLDAVIDRVSIEARN